MNIVENTTPSISTIPHIKDEDFQLSILPYSKSKFSELPDSTTYGFKFKGDYRIGDEGKYHEVLSEKGEKQLKRDKVIQLLESWQEGDDKDQAEAWEFIEKNLDKDRLSDRKLLLLK